MQTITFVIHLERATGRRAQAEDILASCPMPGQILKAIDGRNLSASDVAVASRGCGISPAYPFALAMGEIGCFLSHRAAWNCLLESNNDHALILEDDVHLDPEIFLQALCLAQDNLSRFGYIQFQTRPLRESAAPIATRGPCNLTSPNLTPLRTSGQLVSRQAAKKLLQLTQPFDRPIDTFLQMHWHTGVRLASVSPSGLRDHAERLGGSTISVGKKPLSEKLDKEWKRWRYRRTIRRLSAQNPL